MTTQLVADLRARIERLEAAVVVLKAAGREALVMMRGARKIAPRTDVLDAVIAQMDAALAPTPPAKETTCSSESGAGSSGTSAAKDGAARTPSIQTAKSDTPQGIGASTPPADAAATPDPRGLVEALEWYANRNNYFRGVPCRTYVDTDNLNPNSPDKGDKARNALAAYRKGADDGRA